MKKLKLILSLLFFTLISLPFTGCGSKKIEDSLILVEGDEFVMGDNTITLSWNFYSHQEHYVTVSSFYISPYEVTQKEFEEIMGYNPSFYQGDGTSKQPASGETQELRPVEKLTWYEAIVYCNKLSDKMGLTPVYSKKIITEVAEPSESESTEPEYTTDTSLWGEIPTAATAKSNADWDSIQWNKKADGYRLLTEAEWEFAARGGKLDRNLTSAGFNYDDPEFAKYSWCGTNSDGKTHQVGLLEPNELGIYDLSGNVWEWCWDWFEEDFYTKNEASFKNCSGPENGEFRCLRGASWDDSDEELASIVRGSASPYIPSRRGGFRIARNSK